MGRLDKILNEVIELLKKTSASDQKEAVLQFLRSKNLSLEEMFELTKKIAALKEE